MIQYFEEIVEDDPLRFETYELLGELYEQKENLDKALENYEHSLLLDGGSQPRNHLRLAELCLIEGGSGYDQAVEIMQAGAREIPLWTGRRSPFFADANISSQAKRHTEAMAAFSEARRPRPKPDASDMLNRPNSTWSTARPPEQAGVLRQGRAN